MAQTSSESKSDLSAQYVEQATKLSLETPNDVLDPTKGSTAVQAKFITPLDPVIETADGNRLPAVPPAEALKLNALRNHVVGDAAAQSGVQDHKKAETKIGAEDAQPRASDVTSDGDEESSIAASSAKLDTAVPPSMTHPLFPPLPLYGPPSRLRNLQCTALRFSSFVLSCAFLGVIVLGSIFTSIPVILTKLGYRLTCRSSKQQRPFHEEEIRREAARTEAAREWKRQRKRRSSQSEQGSKEHGRLGDEYQPTEGGPAKLVCDIGYYARRVGLDVEEYEVQTEDGFVIGLWHVYNPAEYVPHKPDGRKHKSPSVFSNDASGIESHQRRQYTDGSRRYPVLLMHGLLQSAGAYCSNDDDSLAFYLCKSGYDVWLGNNRCGFNPKHTSLDYYDPRMWAWNIRQMGVMDLPALISRILLETGFQKVGLVCHSQGTTQTFVALAKQQRPDLGQKISVFCALAPAVYAGPLIGKMCFKFMRVISPAMFRIFFGIHSFIPIMMTAQRLVPGRIYGMIGYQIFSFLFDWSDLRWDRGLRDRFFQFSPVYVSSESMRWWLGRECFASHKCILATRQDKQTEEAQDEQWIAGEKMPATNVSSSFCSSDDDDDDDDDDDKSQPDTRTDNTNQTHNEKTIISTTQHEITRQQRRERNCWYDSNSPPFALWIAGSDDLVDGRRLLHRFHAGREPHVNLVHAKVIDEYEHLDVLWAMDMIEQVGQEVRDVIWRTVGEGDKKVCRGVNVVE